MNDAEQFDLSGMSDMVIEKKGYGSVVKSEDSETSDPLAVMTILDLDSKVGYLCGRHQCLDLRIPN
jgi:hypothetical protein